MQFGPSSAKRNLLRSQEQTVSQSEACPTSASSLALPGKQQMPSMYGLSDEDYEQWKSAAKAAQNDGTLQEVLSTLSAKPKLLNWRNPVTGQTLLHALLANGASDHALQKAVELGCDSQLKNSFGETPEALASRKGRLSVFNSWQTLALPMSPPASAPYANQRQMPRIRTVRGSQPKSRSAQQSVLRSSFEAVNSSASIFEPVNATETRAPSQRDLRRSGKKLCSRETASVPKACLELDLDIQQDDDLDMRSLEESIMKAYGGRAQVQIDNVLDKSPQCSFTSTSSITAAGSVLPSQRLQNIKCRVMFDDAAEARTWQCRSQNTRVVQTCLAEQLNLAESAVEFDQATQMNEVNSVTLKLDSDSTHILCGACLLYERSGECEDVVCYNNRASYGGSIQHSGDTQIDGKSVHTIKLALSDIPDNINQLYFTLCSCGPANLSGFVNPSISLFENNQPGSNLLEYSINQAGASASCVMARMLQQPTWSAKDLEDIFKILRGLRIPLLCIDLCLAMAQQSSWKLQALGTPEWNTPEKICSNYHFCKDLIKAQLNKEAEQKIA
jgi:stress response protein SCP2